MIRVAPPDPFVRSLTEYGYRPTGPGMLRWDPDFDPMAGVTHLTLYGPDRPPVPTAVEILAEMRAALDAMSRMEHGPPTDSTSEQDAAGSRAGHSTSDEGSALSHARPEGQA